MKIFSVEFIHSTRVDGLPTSHLYLLAEEGRIDIRLEAPCVVIRVTKPNGELARPRHIPLANVRGYETEPEKPKKPKEG